MMNKLYDNNYWYLVITLLLIIATTCIMKSDLYNIILNFDHKIIDSINYFINTNNTNFTSIFKVLTNFGDFYIPLVIIICIFIFIKNKKYFYILISGYSFSGLIVYISKTIIQRPRPLSALIDIPKSFSFPSGHTLTSIVFYITLWYLLTYKATNKVKIITFIMTLLIVILIGISRIYLGVHYFSDVIGGIILALPILFMIINISKKVLR